MIECQVCKHQFEDDALLNCPACGTVFKLTDEANAVMSECIDRAREVGGAKMESEFLTPMSEKKAEDIVLEVQDVTHKSDVEPDNG